MAKRDVKSAAWAKLSHAYGKATDVPGMLQALGSSKAKARAEAIWKLGASICHQGTFYSATPPAIPVLVDLVAKSKTKDRHAILRLLADIATFDDHERFILDGVEEKRIPALPRVYTRSLDAVRKGFPVFAKLLDAQEPEVRAAAAFLLAWLDGRARESLPLVRSALDREKDASTKAALCLSLAYLARYVASKAHDAAMRALLDHKNATVRTAAAIAIAHSAVGAVDEKVVRVLAEGAPQKTLAKTKLPWLGGDSAFFSTRVLSALPRSTPTVDDALVRVIDAGGSGASYAANVLVRRLFAEPEKKTKRNEETPKPAPRRRGTYERRDRQEQQALDAITTKPSDLSTPQRRLLAALAKHGAAFDADLRTGLEERALPSTFERLARFLGPAPAPTTCILDRSIATDGMPDATVTDIIVRAAKAKGAARATELARITDALAADDVLATALTAITDIDGDDIHHVTVDLAWAAGQGASAKALKAATARLEKEGAPKRTTEDGDTTFPLTFVAVGVALAASAIVQEKTPEPLVDRYLQEAYGFLPRVRDALVALPLPRREKWLLDKKRDDCTQPAEFFVGAWPYWLVAPTKKITARALEHLAVWKPNDPWGGAREKFAEPHLVAYIEAVRAAHGDASALEAALAKMRGRALAPKAAKSRT